MQGSISLIKGNKVLSKPPTEECLFIEEFNSFQTQASVITVKSTRPLRVNAQVIKLREAQIYYFFCLHHLPVSVCGPCSFLLSVSKD